MCGLLLALGCVTGGWAREVLSASSRFRQVKLSSHTVLGPGTCGTLGRDFTSRCARGACLSEGGALTDAVGGCMRMRCFNTGGYMVDCGVSNPAWRRW